MNLCGESDQDKFPSGMLGIHFPVDLDTILYDVIPLAIKVLYTFPLNWSPILDEVIGHQTVSYFFPLTLLPSSTS